LLELLLKLAQVQYLPVIQSTGIFLLSKIQLDIDNINLPTAPLSNGYRTASGYREIYEGIFGGDGCAVY